MIVLARLFARLVGLALLAVIAAAGLAAAVFCIQSGHATLSLSGLAADLQLPQLRGDVGRFLADTTARGPVAVIAAVCGAGAVGVGLVLLIGAWVRPRPRRIVLVQTAEGSLGVLRRPFSRAIAARLAEHEALGRVRARSLARRRGMGGRVRVAARAAGDTDRRQARALVRADLTRLLEGLPLRVKVTARASADGGHGRREATP